MIQSFPNFNFYVDVLLTETFSVVNEANTIFNRNVDISLTMVVLIGNLVLSDSATLGLQFPDNAVT